MIELLISYSRYVRQGVWEGRGAAVCVCVSVYATRESQRRILDLDGAARPGRGQLPVFVEVLVQPRSARDGPILHSVSRVLLGGACVLCSTVLGPSSALCLSASLPKPWHFVCRCHALAGVRVRRM